MYPMPTPQFPPVNPANSFLSRGFLPGAAGQFGNFPIQQGAAQSGGFLAKILGGAQAGGGGFSNIAGILQNAQKAIGIFQQVSPMVQQYGPLVKSLPSLINIMRANGSSAVETKEDTESIESVKKTKGDLKENSQEKSSAKKGEKRKAGTSKKKKQLAQKKSSSNGNSTNGIPAPKLYI